MNALNFIKENGLRTGDRLIVEKGPLVYHHAIVILRAGLTPMVAENQPGFGVQYTTLEHFLVRAGMAKIRIQAFTGTEDARENVIPRIDSLIGRTYNLVTFNCEHFANFIQNGVAVSTQVGVVILSAVILGIGWLAFSGE
jgi:hypothetical protein